MHRTVYSMAPSQRLHLGEHVAGEERALCSGAQPALGTGHPIEADPQRDEYRLGLVGARARSKVGFRDSLGPG